MLGDALPRDALAQMDFAVGGVMRCDNRIAKIMQNFGMDVRNPSYLLRSMHVQRNETRSYFGDNHVAGETAFVRLDLA